MSLSLKSNATNDGIIQVEGTDRIFISSTTGSVGLGTTPASWSTGTALQFGGNGVLWDDASNNVRLMKNAYWDGAFKYITTGPAAIYNLSHSAGGHRWQIAPSGTAGSAITLTDVMVLDLSGNLGIGAGATSAGKKLQVSGGSAISTTIGSRESSIFISNTGFNAVNTGGEILFGRDVGGAAQYGAGITFNLVGAVADGIYGDLSFSTKATTSASLSERMRLDSSGNLLLGGTSAPNGRLDVQAVTAGSTEIALTRSSSSAGIAGGPNISFRDGTTTNANIIQMVSGYLQFWNYGAGSWTQRAFISNTGEFGVGASTTNRISMTYDSGNGIANIGANSTGGNTYLAFGTSSAGVYYTHLRLGTDGNLYLGGTNSTVTPALNKFMSVQATTDNQIVGYSISSFESSGTVNNRRASFYMDDSTGIYGITSTHSTGPMQFDIGQGGTSLIRIDTSGNVGIGATTVGAKLHTYSATGNVRNLIESGSAASVAVSTVYKTANRTWEVGQAPGLGNNFFTVYDSTAAATRITVDTSGNVGIGADAPTHKLHVNGPLRVEEAFIDTLTINVTNTVSTSVYSFLTTSNRTAELLVQVTDSTNSQYHSAKMLIVHDGTTAQLVQYGVVTTASELGTFDAVISGGSVYLNFTATAATTKVVKVAATLLTV